MDADLWFEDVEARLAERMQRPRVPKALKVLYDPECALCRRCCDWMQHQQSYVSLTFLPCTANAVRAEYSALPWLGDELIVIGDGGEVWIGPAAFLTCLWALVDYREWSFRLSGPTFSALAQRFFMVISAQRHKLAALFRTDCDDGACSLKHV